MILAAATPTGIMCKFTDTGVRDFIYEPDAAWGAPKLRYRRQSTAKRVAKFYNCPVDSVRVVKNLK